MKATSLKWLALVLVLAAFASSCTTYSHSMKSPQSHIEFDKADFDFSEQVSAEATINRILGINFSYLFTKELGYASYDNVQMAILGPYLQDKASMFAMYRLLQENPGYDVIVYPQVRKKDYGIPILFTTTNVRVTARLARLK